MIKLTLNWRLTVFTGLFLPLLISLGFWQLSRAEEKRSLLQAWEQQQLTEVTELQTLSQQDLQAHQRVRLHARISAERYWLLEARVYKGQPGYEVVMPAQLASGEWLLINRGWVPANPDRRILPRIETSSVAQDLWGEVRLPTHTALINEQDNPVVMWPHRVLEINLPLMESQFGQPLFGLIVALDEDHPSAFVVQSNPINMPPVKHQAYAVQWFSMAFALVILWLLTNTNIIALLRDTNKTRGK